MSWIKQSERKVYPLNKWEYEITKNEGEGIKGYGWHLDIYKNGEKVFSDGAFGSEQMAEVTIKDYILLHEFDVDREYE